MTKYFNKFMNNIIRKLRPGNIIRLFLGLIPILLLTITFSCEEDPSELGADLLPPGDKIYIHVNDTLLTFTGTVHENKPMNTTNLSHYTLGIQTDEYFGAFKGEYACQFYPASYIKDVAEIIVDSAVLFLDIDSIYGLTNNNDVYFNVYGLSNDIFIDSLYYYSDVDINSFFTEELPINTNSIISGDTLLRLPLSLSFANSLISHGDDIYDSDTAFREVFKGLSISPQLINSTGGLITVNINSAVTRIALYYHTLEEDSIISTYNLSNRFAKYTNDYQAGLVNNFITNTEENDDLLFVQGLNGVRSKIKFTNINEWKDQDSSYSILNAELSIPIADNYDFDAFPPPNKVFFYFSDADSTLIEIEDYSVNNFNGSYDITSKKYKFNISKHLMNMLSNNIEDSCLNFAIYNKSFFPNRVILKSGENIKLSVTYTKH